MTSYTNDDLYQILLHRIRKDRKGSISPEEFESFLNNRSMDYFNQQFRVEGTSKLNLDALSPFMVTADFVTVGQQASTGQYYFSLYAAPALWTTTADVYFYTDYDIAHLINVWHTTDPEAFNTTRVRVDVLSNTELADRFGNAITGPSAAYPFCTMWDQDAYWIYGVTTGYVGLDYYRYPAATYFDYYTDTVGNITYLTDGQAAYTLTTGQIARDESVSGESVTSASVDLEWRDQDAMNILDLVISDVSIALSDPSSYQASLMERQTNVKS